MRRAAWIPVAAALATLSASAFAGGYDRAVALDWDPIPGAVRYEVEWTQGIGCLEKGGIESLKGVSWSRRMPAGHYCVRVRGIGADDRAGQWTEPQIMEVAPKAPPTISRFGDSLQWEPSPALKGFQVQLFDPAGKPLFSGVLPTGEFKVTEAMIPENLRESKLRLEVRSLSEQSAPSPPKVFAFTFEEPPRRRLRKVGPQPLIETASEDEAVLRFRVTGEKPAAPLLAEWVRAREPDARENLRRRTLASQRVELVDRADRFRSPDLKVALGPRFQWMYYRMEQVSGTSSLGARTDHSLGPRFQLDVEYNRDRPIGAYLHFARAPVSLGGYGTDSFQLIVGAEHHYALDSYSESILSFGLGAGWLQVPFPLDPASQGFVNGYHLDAAILAPSLRWAYRFGTHWSAEALALLKAGLPLDVSPGQTSVGGLGGSFSATLGYGLTQDAEIRGGLGLSMDSVGVSLSRANGDQRRVTLIEGGILLQGTYRMSPVEERRPAAEEAFQSHLESPLRLSLSLPIAFRNESSFAAPVGKTAATPNEASRYVQRVELSVHRMANRSGLELNLGYGHFVYAGRGRPEALVALLVGPEGKGFGRGDLGYSVGVGPAFRRLSVITSDDVLQVSTVEAQAKLAIEKAWTDQILSRGTVLGGIPVLAKASALGYPRAGDAWLNYSCSLAAEGGVRLAPNFTLWGGYAYEKMRFGLTDNSLATTSDRTENQLRLGAGVSF